MRTHRLGSQGPELSVVGYGAWEAGGMVGEPPLLEPASILLLSWLLNFNLWDLFKRDEKPDMVFTLVQDTNAARPEKASMRGQHNQLAGGENDPDKPLTPEEKQASAPAQQSTPQKALKPVPPKPQYPPGFFARYCWW